MTFKQLAKEAFKEFQVGDRIKVIGTTSSSRLLHVGTLGIITDISRTYFSYRIEINPGHIAWMHKEEIEHVYDI